MMNHRTILSFKNEIETEKGERVTWELIPPASLWGRKDKFGVLELC